MCWIGAFFQFLSGDCASPSLPPEASEPDPLGELGWEVHRKPHERNDELGSGELQEVGLLLSKADALAPAGPEAELSWGLVSGLEGGLALLDADLRRGAVHGEDHRQLLVRAVHWVHVASPEAYLELAPASVELGWDPLGLRDRAVVGAVFSLVVGVGLLQLGVGLIDTVVDVGVQARLGPRWQGSLVRGLGESPPWVGPVGGEVGNASGELAPGGVPHGADHRAGGRHGLGHVRVDNVLDFAHDVVHLFRLRQQVQRQEDGGHERQRFQKVLHLCDLCVALRCVALRLSSSSFCLSLPKQPARFLLLKERASHR